MQLLGLSFCSWCTNALGSVGQSARPPGRRPSTRSSRRWNTHRATMMTLLDSHHDPHIPSPPVSISDLYHVCSSFSFNHPSMTQFHRSSTSITLFNPSLYHPPTTHHPSSIHNPSSPSLPLLSTRIGLILPELLPLLQKRRGKQIHPQHIEHPRTHQRIDEPLDLMRQMSVGHQIMPPIIHRPFCTVLWRNRHQIQILKASHPCRYLGWVQQ